MRVFFKKTKTELSILNAYLIVFRYQRLSLNLYMYDIFTVVLKKIGIMVIISLTKTQSQSSIFKDKHEGVGEKDHRFAHQLLLSFR